MRSGEMRDQVRVAPIGGGDDHFRLVAESAPVMLWMGDAQGKCLYLNRAQREFWGVPFDAIPTFDWNDTVHPEDSAKLYAPFAEAMQTHRSFTVEARYRRADGAYRTLHTDAHPRFGAGGEFAGMIGVNVDVTETREAEAALREETRLLETLNRTGAAIAAERELDSIVQIVTDGGVAMAGAEFGAFFYNVVGEAGDSYTLYALSGVPREAFARFPMPRATKVFAPTFRGEGVVRSDDILADPRYGQNDPHFGMPRGHLPVRSYLAVPVISRTGEVLGGLFFGHSETARFGARAERMVSGLAAQAAVALDNARLFQAAEREIAQRKAAEAALQRLNATLEQQVAERTEQLRQNAEALRQAQKMEAVGQLTGGIAHDFNNMMAVVMGGLNLLKRRLAKGETDVDMFIDGAMDGAKRAAALTQRLLAFSRQQTLEPEPLDANRMVSGMIDLLSRTLGAQIRVTTALASDLWLTHADPIQLESAILNVSVNARDAMPAGGALTIETANTAVDAAFAGRHGIAPGDYVRISIADTGTGMPPDVATKAFDPFFTTKPVGKGTGLGLSQVFGFVRQSGGHVMIDSAVGAGTKLHIHLPRYDGAPRPRVAGPGAEPILSARPGEIVMVVEDEERVRAYSSESLRELGYTVVPAASGRQAMALIEAGQAVTLLFTDIVMPEMTGPELARAAVAKLPGLKVLYTTGYARNPEAQANAAEHGPNFIAKPFGIEQLARKVRAAIEG